MWLIGVALGTTVALGIQAGGTAAQETWQLSPEPTLVIGSPDGPAELTFHDVRGSVTTAGGEIVVGDDGSTELRVFSSSGRFIRSFGRAGDGPREFRRIGWLDTCGGASIVAYDPMRFRITKWGVDGTLLEDFVVDGPAEMPPYTVRCGPSGRFAVLGWPDVRENSSGPGPYRPAVPLAIADEDGRRERLFGEFPGSERLRTEHNDMPHPFGRSTHLGFGPIGVYVGTADSFAIELITMDGRRRTFGREEPVVSVTPRLREQWVDAFLRRAPEEQRASLRPAFLADERIPNVAPAYGGLRIDRSGFVWVAPYVIGEPGGSGAVEWSVFAPRGAFVATVLMPHRFEPMEIGADYLLGVVTDSLGVERVHRYGLTR